MIRGRIAGLAAAGGLAGLGYYLVVTGKLTVDTGWGRRVRPLGPFGVEVAAPAATVFDVIAAPYLGRTPRAMAGKLQVLDRGTDMVLAEHCTPVHHGRLTAATLETVTFDRPHRIGFRLVRGPVPHITEEFTLTEHDGATRLDYSGELGTDFAAAGQWWADRVAGAWEAAVRSSFTAIQTEAERRAHPAAPITEACISWLVRIQLDGEPVLQDWPVAFGARGASGDQDTAAAAGPPGDESRERAARANLADDPCGHTQRLRSAFAGLATDAMPQACRSFSSCRVA